MCYIESQIQSKWKHTLDLWIFEKSTYQLLVSIYVGVAALWINFDEPVYNIMPQIVCGILWVETHHSFVTFTIAENNYVQPECCWQSGKELLIAIYSVYFSIYFSFELNFFPTKVNASAWTC